MVDVASSQNAYTVVSKTDPTQRHIYEDQSITLLSNLGGISFLEEGSSVSQSGNITRVTDTSGQITTTKIENGYKISRKYDKNGKTLYQTRENINSGTSYTQYYTDGVV